MALWSLSVCVPEIRKFMHTMEIDPRSEWIMWMNGLECFVYCCTMKWRAWESAYAHRMWDENESLQNAQKAKHLVKPNAIDIHSLYVYMAWKMRANFSCLINIHVLYTLCSLTNNNRRLCENTWSWRVYRLEPDITSPLTCAAWKITSRLRELSGKINFIKIVGAIVGEIFFASWFHCFRKYFISAEMIILSKRV